MIGRRNATRWHLAVSVIIIEPAVRLPGGNSTSASLSLKCDCEKAVSRFWGCGSAAAGASKPHSTISLTKHLAAYTMEAFDFVLCWGRDSVFCSWNETPGD